VPRDTTPPPPPDPQFDHHFTSGTELTPQEALAYLGA
jgi:hypothetical protein